MASHPSADVTREFLSRASLCEETTARIWEMTNLGEACRVFPGLLRCIARQLRIAARSADFPIEVIAGACRTTFETNICARLAVANPAAVTDLVSERAFDEIDILERITALAHEQTPPALLQNINERVRQIQAAATRFGFVRRRPVPWRQRAQAVGVLAEYDALYGFYSKYVHASSWLMANTDESRDSWQYREVLLFQTQLYAGDTLKRVSDHIFPG